MRLKLTGHRQEESLWKERESLGPGAYIESNLPFMGQEFDLLLTMLSL